MVIRKLYESVSRFYINFSLFVLVIFVSTNDKSIGNHEGRAANSSVPLGPISNAYFIIH